MKLKVKDTVSFVHWVGNNESEIEAFMNDMGFYCEIVKSIDDSIIVNYKSCGQIVWDYNYCIELEKGQFLVENIYAESYGVAPYEKILITSGFNNTIFEVVNE